MAWQSGPPRLAPYQKRQLSRDEFWGNGNMHWCRSFPTGWHHLDGWCMCCRCWYIWILTWPNVLGASRVTGVTWFITMSRGRRIVVPSHTRWSFFPCFTITVWIVWRRWHIRYYMFSDHVESNIRTRLWHQKPHQSECQPLPISDFTNCNANHCPYSILYDFGPRRIEQGQWLALQLVKSDMGRGWHSGWCGCGVITVFVYSIGNITGHNIFEYTGGDVIYSKNIRGRVTWYIQIYTSMNTSVYIVTYSI